MLGYMPLSALSIRFLLSAFTLSFPHLLISEQNVKVSDTTTADSSTIAGKHNLLKYIVFKCTVRITAYTR